jgi:outer membrane protein OmpA-like peptidoglycan-associated protein
MNTLKLCLAAFFAISIASCSETPKTDNVTNDEDTMVMKTDDQPVGTPKAEDAWASVDWNSPVVQYEEVKSKDVDVRGTDRYTIYGLGENVLFESGKADIKKSAAANLSQVAASINQRYAGGKVKVYGYTDDKGSDEANKALSRQRAEAVMSWLTTDGGISAERIVMYAEGEERPVASNDNAAGRQQNRRVEVVAMKP